MGEEATLFVSRRVAGGFTDGIEGAACDGDGNVYAVDFARAGTVGRIVPGEDGARLWVELPGGGHGCGTVPGPGGALFVADYAGHNVLRVDLATGGARVHAHCAGMHQPNDLAIRPDGTLFASDPDWTASTGRLWRIDVSGAVHLLETGMGTANGIEVSPDDTALYVNETVQRTIWAYRLDALGGVHDKRLFARFPDHGLDGMRCDVAGNLYVTRHGKGEVAVLDPAGRVMREIPLERGRACTNLAFGGPDWRTVYVTVADGGHVEAFRVDVPGRAGALWAGWTGAVRC